MDPNAVNFDPRRYAFASSAPTDHYPHQQQQYGEGGQGVGRGYHPGGGGGAGAGSASLSHGHGYGYPPSPRFAPHSHGIYGGDGRSELVYSGDTGSYYPANHHYPLDQQQQQQQHAHQATAAYYRHDPSITGGYAAGYHHPSQATELITGAAAISPQSPGSVPPGCFFPVETFQPQLFGAPVSALAYDTHYEALFVTSDAQSMSRGRFNHRASMLVTHSTVDGMLYSSVAGHPEASPKVLKRLYCNIYSHTASGNNTFSDPSSTYRRNKIPSHAFRPSYGNSDPGLPDTAAQPIFQLGITDLVPLGQGYVASVSPAGVRVHAHGGLQTADFHTEGMCCMTVHPGHDQTAGLLHCVTVGGTALDKSISEKSGNSNLLCLDIWQGLRIVAAATLLGTTVTAITASHIRSSIIAGCSDGTIRVLDSRLREMAKLKSHTGGVVDLAVSDDGNLLATTGYGSRGTFSSACPSLYSFPDPNIGLFDLRYLGRGGISHAFAGLNGGPRYLSFLPPVTGQEQGRLLVASGQVGGGMQLIVPFKDDCSSLGPENFIVPQLDRNEFITGVDVQNEKVALGTSKGNVLQYRIPEYSKTTTYGRGTSGSGVFIPPPSPNRSGNFATTPKYTSNEKELLKHPPIEPPLAELQIEPLLLMKSSHEGRGAANYTKKPLGTLYIMGQNPTLTPVGNAENPRFGPLGEDCMVGPGRNHVSDSFFARSTHSVDFVRTVLASDLDLDLLSDHQTERLSKRMQAIVKNRGDPLSNPNKFLYNAQLYEKVYKESFSRFKRRPWRTHREGEDDIHLFDIPPRYRLSLRPTQKSAATFSHAEHNNTDLYPGWDYPPTMPNAFVPPVLMLLYFIPEARRALLRCQFSERTSPVGRKDGLVSELSFLFHHIDSLAGYAMIFKSSGKGKEKARLGAWSPSNFVACLAAMPEAEQLQILDGSPAAVETPRRPEAFYRFLLYQIDKELGKGNGSALKLMDKLGGVDFVSVNEFISNSTTPTTSSTRAMTVELCYEPFLDKGKPEKKNPSFGEVLYRTLSRETRLRAFNDKSGAYETIVQRKIAITLPKILSLSCACAGRKESDGLFVWRNTGHASDHWLPEAIEIEITERGNIIVHELVRDLHSGKEEWVTHGNDTSISTAVAEVLSKRKSRAAQKLRYELSAVVSMIRDELDKNIPDEIVAANNDNGYFGHHVLHVRVPCSQEKRILIAQRDELKSFMSRNAHPFALVNDDEKELMEERMRYAIERVEELEDRKGSGGWVLLNGFKVSQTSAEDARAFHVGFKEPCIVVFRCQDDSDKKLMAVEEQPIRVPSDVMCTRSLTNNMRSNFVSNQKPGALPGPGDLIAFDAEFVSVQEEVSTLTETGLRVTIQETRHAMARISAIACPSKTVVFDDFVLPLEKVADYLTRFSGIVERDLNPKESQRHLITTRAAYLKLRCLIERGCIFVGHGLSRDFWTAGLMVPADQVIDTVEIYHKPAQRYVSLRFLTNFVLKRDMQQEVHDSLEDATAAFELFEKAVELREKGEFEKLLDNLYEYGQRVDWKLGIE